MTTPGALHTPERRFYLSAQIPPSPPDETASIERVRYLSDAETEQFRKDVELIRSVVKMAPYARAFTAYRQLTTLVNELALGTDSRPTTRGVEQLRRGLSGVSRAFAELPPGLVAALDRRLGADSDAAHRLNEAISAFVTEPEVKQTIALHDTPAEQLVIVDFGDQRELALPTDKPIGILAAVEASIELAGRLLSRWLLEQRDMIDAASRRLSALDGEVFRGASAVVEVRTADGEDGEIRTLGMTPMPLPLSEMYALQHALARAERILQAPDREPALRGVRAMTDEQIGAITAVDAPAETAEEPQAPDERDRPIDLAALVRHLHLGVTRLERAWARALAEEDVKATAAEWESLLHAMVGETQHADRDLIDTERRFELPPSTETILALEAEPDSAAADRQRRLAQAMAIGDLVALLPALREPTATLTDQAGRRVSWFSSGAFTMARDQLGLIIELAGMTGDTPEAVRSFRLAERSELRADPEATIVHLARALKALDPERRPPLGADTRALAERVTKLAARIGAGDSLDGGAISLLAHAGRDAVREIVMAALAPEAER